MTQGSISGTEAAIYNVSNRDFYELMDTHGLLHSHARAVCVIVNRKFCVRSYSTDLMLAIGNTEAAVHCISMYDGVIVK